MYTDVSDLSDDSISEESSDEKTPRKKKKPKKNRKDQKKKEDKPVNEQPSVYSSAEIRRHKKRLKTLRALESQTSESDSESSSEHCNVDPDLDINLRIFEASVPSVENVIIGEIQCNVKDDATNVEETNEKGNKNSNVFKLSVNANFTEQTATEEPTPTENEEPKEKPDEESRLTDDDDDALEAAVDRILSDNSLDLSDDDSDLEILMSKPIIRKRALPVVRKEKPTESTSGDKKLTMYDLIYDTMSPRDDDDFSDCEQIENGEVKKKEKKSKVRKESKELLEPVEVVEKIETVEKKSSHVPVPQLKVTADGEVVVDMDSLVIEQTGLSNARNAIANSQVIEECGSNYTSYNRKCNYRKQWSPQDTLKFYQVLSTIGTDFSLMVTLFPGRTRTCMKRKFKREEKCNADLILKALTCRQNFDMKLLEEELRLKEAKVNKMRENTKKSKKNEKKNTEKEVVKEKKTVSMNGKRRRKSYFERAIECFQTT